MVSYFYHIFIVVLFIIIVIIILILFVMFYFRILSFFLGLKAHFWPKSWPKKPKPAAQASSPGHRPSSSKPAARRGPGLLAWPFPSFPAVWAAPGPRPVSAPCRANEAPASRLFLHPARLLAPSLFAPWPRMGPRPAPPAGHFFLPFGCCSRDFGPRQRRLRFLSLPPTWSSPCWFLFYFPAFDPRHVSLLTSLIRLGPRPQDCFLLSSRPPL